MALVTLPPESLEVAFRAVGDATVPWLQAMTPRPVDVVNVILFIDYSRSMQGRLRAIIRGIDKLDRRMRDAGIRPSYRVVRFAETVGKVGHGIAGTDVSSPVTDTTTLAWYFRHPTMGSEHLIDAIAEGTLSAIDRNVPNLAIIVSDEPPSSRLASVEDVTELILASGIRWCAIIPVSGDSARSNAATEAILASGGTAFPMPASLVRNRQNM